VRCTNVCSQQCFITVTIIAVSGLVLVLVGLVFLIVYWYRAEAKHKVPTTDSFLPMSASAPAPQAGYQSISNVH
jgi:hypothetical protein